MCVCQKLDSLALKNQTTFVALRATAAGIDVDLKTEGDVPLHFKITEKLWDLFPQVGPGRKSKEVNTVKTDYTANKLLPLKKLSCDLMICVILDLRKK